MSSSYSRSSAIKVLNLLCKLFWLDSRRLEQESSDRLPRGQEPTIAQEQESPSSRLCNDQDDKLNTFCVYSNCRLCCASTSQSKCICLSYDLCKHMMMASCQCQQAAPGGLRNASSSAASTSLVKQLKDLPVKVVIYQPLLYFLRLHILENEHLFASFLLLIFASTVYYLYMFQSID